MKKSQLKQIIKEVVSEVKAGTESDWQHMVRLSGDIERLMAQNKREIEIYFNDNSIDYKLEGIEHEENEDPSESYLNVWMKGGSLITIHQDEVPKNWNYNNFYDSFEVRVFKKYPLSNYIARNSTANFK